MNEEDSPGEFGSRSSSSGWIDATLSLEFPVDYYCFHRLLLLLLLLLDPVL